MRGKKNTNPGPLEAARREAGLSRKKLSELTGVSFRTIECYEQGKNNINMAAAETVRTLARALNVPMEKIMNDEELGN